MAFPGGSKIMELFGSKPAAPATTEDQPQTVTDNKTIPNDATPKADGTGVAAIPKAGEGDKSPMEKYGDLWKADPEAKPPVSLVPELKVDPKKLMEQAKGIDFSKAIDAETLQKASSGDVNALASAIAQAAQAAIAHSANTTVNVVSSALKKQEEIFTTQVMPSILDRHTKSLEVRADNPLYNDPSAAPILQAVEQQLINKYPTASPQEITAMAKEYLGGFATNVLKQNGLEVVDPSKQTGTRTSKLSRVDTDWDQWAQT